MAEKQTIKSEENTGRGPLPSALGRALGLTRMVASGAVELASPNRILGRRPDEGPEPGVSDEDHRLMLTMIGLGKKVVEPLFPPLHEGHLNYREHVSPEVFERMDHELVMQSAMRLGLMKMGLSSAKADKYMFLVTSREDDPLAAYDAQGPHQPYSSADLPQYRALIDPTLPVIKT